MKKKLLVFVLIVTILTYAFLSSFNIPNKYVITPYQYVKRMAMCFDEMPDFDFEPLKGVYERHEPEYKTLVVNYAEWQDVEVDGLTDLIPAFGRFCNSIMHYISGMFKTVFMIFPNMFDNFKMMLEFIFSPFIVIANNIGEAGNTIIEAKQWRNSVLLSFLPFDWQQYIEDGNDLEAIRLPLGIKIVKEAFDKHYGAPEAEGGWRGGR